MWQTIRWGVSPTGAGEVGFHDHTTPPGSATAAAPCPAPVGRAPSGQKAFLRNEPENRPLQPLLAAIQLGSAPRLESIRLNITTTVLVIPRSEATRNLSLPRGLQPQKARFFAPFGRSE